jgi:cytochrome b involved in lipid metabolism
MSQEPSQGLTNYTKDSLFELSAKNPTNTYICIHENVYDVTQFQDEVI